MRTALLLIAHGSREEQANADLFDAVRELRRRGRYEIVEAAFLELAEPDIDTGAVQCIAAGAMRVILLPYFLSAGVHVSRDLEDARRRLSERHPLVQFRLAEPIGRHPLSMEVLAERARDAEQE